MRYTILFFVGMAFFACKKASTETVNDVFDVNTATRLYSGTLQSNAHPVSGTAGIYRAGTQLKLYLQNFSTDNGPDVRIYLAKDISANNFIDLGLIKSTNGNQLYDFSDPGDLVNYKYVLVWCKQFSVLFGHAPLN
jgi:hypothetical protein